MSRLALARYTSSATAMLRAASYLCRSMSRMVVSSATIVCRNTGQHKIRATCECYCNCTYLLTAKHTNELLVSCAALAAVPQTAEPSALSLIVFSAQGPPCWGQSCTAAVPTH